MYFYFLTFIRYLAALQVNMDDVEMFRKSLYLPDRTHLFGTAEPVPCWPIDIRRKCLT